MLEEEAVWWPQEAVCQGTNLGNSHAWSAVVAPWQPQFGLGLFLGTGRVLATIEKAEKQETKPSPKKSHVGAGMEPVLGREQPWDQPSSGQLMGPLATVCGLWVGPMAVPGAQGHWHVLGGTRAVLGCRQGAGGLWSTGGCLVPCDCSGAGGCTDGGLWHSVAPPTPRSVLPAGDGVVCLGQSPVGDGVCLGLLLPHSAPPALGRAPGLRTGA